MKNLDKMAAKDAADFMAAEMAYGEGAGTRRKLVQTPIYQKIDTVPGYVDAFNKAYDELDIDKYAKIAIKERKSAVRAAKAGRNLRALKSGNLNNLTTGVFIIAGGVVVARQTGLDKVVEAEVKKVWKLLKDEYTVRKEGRKLRLIREEQYNR